MLILNDLGRRMDKTHDFAYLIDPAKPPVAVLQVHVLKDNGSTDSDLIRTVLQIFKDFSIT
jgi:hypothetical protein